MGKLTFDLPEFQQAAIKYRSDLLKIPMFAIRDTTQYMTVRTGITGTELVGQESVKAEIAPYKANRKVDVDLDLILRPLTTFFGSLNAEFDPNEAISTLLGHQASQAMEGKLASTPTARDVLALIAKAAGEKLHDCLWNAVRNPSGNKTKDLFNGFDTIAKTEITAGNISEKAGNYLDIGDEITQANVLDVFDLILDTMHPKLRAVESTVFTTQAIYDMYCRAYKKDTGATPYNTQFRQTFIEGSDGKMKLVPLASKAGSSLITISTKDNMLVGMDQESDAERVNVKDYAPDTLTFMMRLFFGEQYRTISPEKLIIVEHELPSVGGSTTGGSNTGGSTTGGSTTGGESNPSGDSESPAGGGDKSGS